jgi:hypothetical protein
MKTSFTKLKELVLFFLLFISINTNAQTLFNENFSGATFPPDGWSLQSLGSGQNTWYNIPNTTFGAIVFENKTIEQNEQLVTPSFDLSTTGSAFLSFDLRLLKIPFIDNNTVDFIVKVSTNGGVDWNNLWDDTQFDFGGLLDRRQLVNIDISNYTGTNMNQVKFMFQLISRIHNFDQTSVTQFYGVSISSCPIPNFLSHTPEITWSLPSGFSGTVEIEYGPRGFVQGNGTLVTGLTTNSYIIPNMNCNSYDFFIRSSCGANTSLWTARRSRLLTSGVTYNNLTSNSIEILWQGFGSSFDMEYGPLGFAAGTGTTIQSISNTTVLFGNTYFTQQISNLNSCTRYSFRIKPSCTTTDTWTETSYTTATSNTIPIIPPFNETFDNSSTLCSLGYLTGNPNAAFVSNNALRVVLSSANNIDWWVHSRKFSLQSGVNYNIQVDAKRMTSFAEGVITLKNESDSNFSLNLFEFSNSNLSTVLESFSTIFTPATTANYFLEFRNLLIGSQLEFANLSVAEAVSTISKEYYSVYGLFPNPTSTKFIVENNGVDIKLVSVVDLSGKIILTTNERQIDISALQSGMYLVKIEGADGNTEVHKLFKQ